MIAYVLIGGMRGTTWVQIIKAVLLIAGAGIMTVWVLALYGFSLSAVLGDAVARAGAAGEKLLAPGAQYGKNGITSLDFISLGLALVLGTAGLPHILMRFYTVPTAKEARRSVVWAIWPDRPVLPVHAGARLRRGRAGRAGRDQEGARAAPTRPPRCWPTSSAARSCWASSPRSPSRRSSRWSPA